MALRIRSLPDTAPLTVRVSIDRDDIHDNMDTLLPPVSTVVFVTGCLMNVERRVAYVTVIDVDCLTFCHDDVDRFV